MVRSGPDVDEDKRPEVDDGEPVTEHRTVRRLRQEVIHQAEVGRGKEERDRVVRIPPLHQRVLHAGVERVALEPARRDRERVDDVEHRDRDGRGDVEPDGDVEVLLAALEDGAEKVDGEDHPDDRNGDVNRPLQLRVFLAGSQAQRERDRRADNDELPAPEVNP